MSAQRGLFGIGFACLTVGLCVGACVGGCRVGGVVVLGNGRSSIKSQVSQVSSWIIR